MIMTQDGTVMIANTDGVKVVKKMRCKICELAHKNISRHELWIELQVCRICGNLLDYFSWNGNYMKEYWKK